ncbi:GntR family transcriptional regulator [Sphingomonas sp. TX0543]|uniref:GntR family transcriptional regulator n=1 Tax=unclassified Sphingomonas TaxID=196159 RepID=UPI0010F5D29D|nr:GntR family transcriptional regulator [Sphingomonas sp. 3P27F8]
MATQATPTRYAKALANDAADADVSSLRQTIYEELRHRLITGKIAPGVAISTRGLAQQLGVSQMPVRDALSRISAEGAVEIRSKRAIMVPRMSPARLEEIIRCRLLLEPTAATDALPHIDAARLRLIRAADEATDRALEQGDLNGYMESNYRFHSLIYSAAPTQILNRLVDSLWMQFGPFMRVVYGRYGTSKLVDRHVAATDAIAAKDGAALHEAILGDINDGMDLMRNWEQPGA